MKLKVAIRNPRIRSGLGAALAVLCGLLLWGTRVGEEWVDASYDYLFRFGERGITNKVVLVLMDTEAYSALDQRRGPMGWNRKVHAELVNHLANDKCPLVVFDVFFAEASDHPDDMALLSLLSRLDRVALMADQTKDEHPTLPSARPDPPAPEFIAAAGSNFGVARFAPERGIVRKHWPFPAPGSGRYRSLSWTAAQLAGARLSDEPQEQWLRYYGKDRDGIRPGIHLSYHHALKQDSNYFSDKIVFIGNKPASTLPSLAEIDKFNTPYTRWEEEACGGVELIATAFLNLVNHEWLRRPPRPIEGSIVLVTGALLGAFLCRFRPMIALAIAAACTLAITAAAVTGSIVTDYWFPWLVIVGGQLPCVFVWAWVTRPREELSLHDLIEPPGPEKVEYEDAEPALDSALIDAADYDVIRPPFAKGSFGKVWLARNAIGQWQALKTVYEARFGEDRTPYELELRGISNYKPISDKHPGLLRVDFVSKPKLEGYFYYVMELGDAITTGWETDPTTYRPRDLASVIRDADHHRLPIAECVRIISAIAEALDFLHQQGFTHRDVKPSNIIFVNGRPKLADVGLVRQIRPADEVKTWAGTVGYMPPHERPGTVAADIYALGMVLYVISTGKPPGLFPELSSTLAATVHAPEFMRLNTIILKACEPDQTRRYASAAEFCAALAPLQKMCEQSSLPVS